MYGQKCAPNAFVCIGYLWLCPGSFLSVCLLFLVHFSDFCWVMNAEEEVKMFKYRYFISLIPNKFSWIGFLGKKDDASNGGSLCSPLNQHFFTRKIYRIKKATDKTEMDWINLNLVYFKYPFVMLVIFLLLLDFFGKLLLRLILIPYPYPDDKNMFGRF